MRAALVVAALLALPAPALARTFSVDSSYGSGSFGSDVSISSCGCRS